MAETIYNLIPTEEEPVVKPPRHVSKFKNTAKYESNAFKSSHKTFGPSKVPLSSTRDFTKKNDSSNWKEKVSLKSQAQKDDDHCGIDFVDQKFAYGCEKRAPIPDRHDPPILGLKTTKQFIHQNAVDNMMSVPKKVEPTYVDTRVGDKHKLRPSGLEPFFVKKQDFGKMPGYLMKRNEDVKRAREEYDAFVKEYVRRGQMNQLSATDRQEMIDGLKANWDLIHKEYQNMSVMIDTIPKRLRKARMETEMSALEKDIDLLERYKTIYIAN